MFNIKYGITGVGTTKPGEVVSILKRYGYDGVEWSLGVRNYLADKKIESKLKTEVSEAGETLRNERLEIISLTRVSFLPIFGIKAFTSLFSNWL